MERTITKDYLKDHPTHIFVFGDNLKRTGYGGAALLRDCVNSYGFITKKAPDSLTASYYKPEEYEAVFYKEIQKLEKMIIANPEYKYLISKLGAGLANKFNIWEEVVQPKIVRLLGKYKNVEFLWDTESLLISSDRKYYFAYISLDNTLCLSPGFDKDEIYKDARIHFIKTAIVKQMLPQTIIAKDEKRAITMAKTFAEKFLNAKN